MKDRIHLKQIRKNIWLLNDNDESTGYLILGDKKALLIDTMNGLQDVSEIVRKITSLPLMVVNTHGHWDHVYGNLFFEQVYINPKDIPLANRYFSNQQFVNLKNISGLEVAKFLPIYDGHIFSLGGIEIEVYETPGHTAGSIVLLDRTNRILFTGDTIIEQTWMQMEDALPMETLLNSLDRLHSIRNCYDYILTGHSKDLEDASLYEAHRQAVFEVCQGKTENDEEYIWFGGKCMAHSYGKSPRRIVYNK